MKTVRMKKSGRTVRLTDRQARNRLWKKITYDEQPVVKAPLPESVIFNRIVEAARRVGELTCERESKPKRRYRRRDMEAEDCSTSSANS